MPWGVRGLSVLARFSVEPRVENPTSKQELKTEKKALKAQLRGVDERLKDYSKCLKRAQG